MIAAAAAVRMWPQAGEQISFKRRHPQWSLPQKKSACLEQMKCVRGHGPVRHLRCLTFSSEQQTVKIIF